MFSALLTTLIGCQNETDAKSNISSNVDSEKVVEETIYKINEEAFITNENSENVYSITMDSVEVVEVDGNYQDYLELDWLPRDTKQMLVLTYTYKYVSEDDKLDELEINPEDFQVFDEDNRALEYITIGSSDYPFDATIFQAIKHGRSVQTYGPYALKKDTNLIQVDFSSELYQQTLTFEISLGPNDAS